MAMDDSFVPASVLPYSLRETEGLRPVWTPEDGFSLYLRQAYNGNEDGWILSPGLHGDSWVLDEIANSDAVDHLLEQPDGTIVPVYLRPGRTAVYAGAGVCSSNGSFRINSYDVAYDDGGELVVAAMTQPRSGGTSRTLRLCTYDGLESRWTTARASAAYASRIQLRIDDGGDPEVSVMDGIYVRRYQRTLDTWDEEIVRHEAVADSYAGYIVGVGVGSRDRVYVGYTGSAGPPPTAPPQPSPSWSEYQVRSMHPVDDAAIPPLELDSSAPSPVLDVVSTPDDELVELPSDDPPPFSTPAAGHPAISTGDSSSRPRISRARSPRDAEGDPA